MKLLVYSDLHLEFSDFDVPQSGYDVVILAGDIHIGESGVIWAVNKFKDVPVIYICGNHEYYHGEIRQVQDRIRAQTKNTNVHYCENETVYIDKTRFVCATLWTDFQIQGDKYQQMMLAGYWMNDYRLIELDNEVLRPEDTERFHQSSRLYLENELRASNDGIKKTVVVTHHAPSAQSLRHERVGVEVSCAYASSLELMMLDYAPDLWIHGHTHESVDYQVGTTRVVSNPRGYSKIANGDGNANFLPVCIIEP